MTQSNETSQNLRNDFILNDETDISDSELLSSEMRYAPYVSLSNALDKLFREHPEKQEISDDSRCAVSDKVKTHKLHIDCIIRYDGGHTMFILDDYQWKVMRIKSGKIDGMKDFEAVEGMQGNWIKIVFFEDFYCIFHNWRGCSYGDYSEPYVSVYCYSSLVNIHTIHADEADVSGVHGRDWETIVSSQNNNFDKFYNALNQQGFDTENAKGADFPSCLIYCSE